MKYAKSLESMIKCANSWGSVPKADSMWQKWRKWIKSWEGVVKAYENS
jgi:hypothetical protein